MPRVENITEDRHINNKAWFLFNQALNWGIPWEDASMEAELEAERLKAKYDDDFYSAEENQTDRELVYERSMNQFEKLIHEIRNLIPNQKPLNLVK